MSQFCLTGLCLEKKVRVNAKFFHPRQEGILVEAAEFQSCLKLAIERD